MKAVEIDRTNILEKWRNIVHERLKDKAEPYINYCFLTYYYIIQSDVDSKRYIDIWKAHLSKSVRIFLYFHIKTENVHIENTLLEEIINMAEMYIPKRFKSTIAVEEILKSE